MKKLQLLIIFLINTAFLANGLHSQNLNLIVSGSSKRETKTIDSLGYKKLFSNFNLLENEVKLLISKLEVLGYIDILLRQNNKINDSTYKTKLELGQKYHTIYIYYDKSIISKDFLNLLAEDVSESYFKTTLEDVSLILMRINQHLSDKGFPFSNVRLSSLKKETKTKRLEAMLQVDLNSERTIEKIIVKGYDNFPKSYLRHYIKLKPNRPLNLNSLKKKANTLNSLQFVSLAREPEILFTQDSSTIYLYLEKRKSNTFDGFLGFGTNETNNKLEFDGYLDLSLVNNLNFGESITLNYKSDENEQKNFYVNLNTPYIFNSPLGSEISLNIFKKDSSFTTVNQSLNLFYQINNQQTILIGVENVNSNRLLENNTLINIDDYKSTFYNLRYQFLKPQYNNLLFTNNFKFDIKFGFGNRNHEATKTSQTFYHVNTYKIFNLNSENNIFLRINSSGIDYDNYFLNELLRFGGINSIRGFDENSLLATLYGFANLEYRYNLSPSIYVHTITDGAYLKNTLNNITENLYGIGLGFGILTKSGLLKFNYATGKTKGQKLKFSNSKIHISLNARF